MKKLSDLFDINSNIKIDEIYDDSRKKVKNGLFFAIKGITVDGHDFIEKAIENGANPCDELPEIGTVLPTVREKFPEVDASNLGIGSTIFAVKPGDGSAREQAASCQKVLGGWANIANEYATKRYRSNLINWGMLPLLIPEGELPFTLGDWIFLKDIKTVIEDKLPEVTAYVVKDGKLNEFKMTLGDLTDDERTIILKGCLINYYKG